MLQLSRGGMTTYSRHQGHSVISTASNASPGAHHGFQQGLSGLNAASKNLDVIGHNIANSNTTGFKASRAEFAEMVASAIGAAGGSQRRHRRGRRPWPSSSPRATHHHGQQPGRGHQRQRLLQAAAARWLGRLHPRRQLQARQGGHLVTNDGAQGDGLHRRPRHGPAHQHRGPCH
jgi:hypothetical protein